MFVRFKCVAYVNNSNGMKFFNFRIELQNVTELSELNL